MLIDTLNTRRFVRSDNSDPTVLAVYDFRKGYNLYAPVTVINGQEAFDVSNTVILFNDEVNELI